MASDCWEGWTFAFWPSFSCLLLLKKRCPFLSFHPRNDSPHPKSLREKRRPFCQHKWLDLASLPALWPWDQPSLQCLGWLAFLRFLTSEIVGWLSVAPDTDIMIQLSSSDRWETNWLATASTQQFFNFFQKNELPADSGWTRVCGQGEVISSCTPVWLGRDYELERWGTQEFSEGRAIWVLDFWR